MEYSIIIPAHNSRQTIERCIGSVLKSKFRKRYELIVVDDASCDGTAKAAEGLGAKVVKSDVCRGPGAARNLGAKFAQGTVLIFLDSDVLFFEDTMQQIDDFFEREKDFDAVSCNFHPGCEMTDPVSRYKHLYMCYSVRNQPRSVLWALTSTFAIRGDVFRNMGGFSEKTLVLEDELFGRKAVKNGHKIAFAGQIMVRHLHKYPLLSFFKEEIRRSRVFAVIKYSDFFKKGEHEKENIAQNIKYSILLFPVLIISIFSVRLNFLIFIASVIIFYLINLNFLAACKKQFSVKFMLQAAAIIPLDCLLCWCGIIAGSFDFFGGKRLELS